MRFRHLAILFLVFACCYGYHIGLQRKANNFKPQAQERWFTQRLDHFNPQDTRTWKQRYFVNETFWNHTNGPIFFEVGGEGSISPTYVVGLQIANYASHFNALVVSLEHRFYGESNPLPDLSTQNLRYLSSQQALADAAFFITSIKQIYNSPNSPVITFGCSYPGALAAWFRLKYPTITIAAVASSAPVQATLDFYGYLDVVDKSLEMFTGPECDLAIRKATDQIQSLLRTPQGTKVIESKFKLCSPLKNQYDVATLMAGLMGNWQGTVQYNDENDNPIDIRYLCNIMTNASSDPLSSYVAVNDLFLNMQEQSCLDASYVDVVQQLKNTSIPDSDVGDRSWTYQTCAEFGYFQTTDSKNQPFGNLVPVSYYVQLCKDVFGIDLDPATRVNQTNIYYGGNTIPYDGPTNILFVNGNVDPWHALSVTYHPLPPTISSILINGTAHCANVLPSNSNDSENLLEARRKILNQISEWLKPFTKRATF